MKVYVVKYFFQGDDIENEIKGVYSSLDKAIVETIKLVEFDNQSKMGEYDRPLEMLESQLRFEGYVQHFGEVYYEVEEVVLDKEPSLK